MRKWGQVPPYHGAVLAQSPTVCNRPLFSFVWAALLFFLFLFFSLAFIFVIFFDFSILFWQGCAREVERKGELYWQVT
jgi:hypothetical protein